MIFNKNKDDKSQNSIDCPVKDLLTLIRQDDISQLHNALLGVIVKKYPESEIYLYEQNYNYYETDKNTFSPTLVAYHSKNENHLKNSEILKLSSDSDSIPFDGFQYLPTDDNVQVFSVEGERSRRGLLITVNKDAIDEHYIYTLLSAYNHQVYLLRNKDFDALTGLYNRQSFDSKLAKLHKNLSYENRSVDVQTKYIFALLDIDYFKLVNDKYGHVYGDEVLLLFSNIMKETFRDTDRLFRYGGEEFSILLSDVDLNLADIILNRFRENIEKFNFPMENKVTTSIGYCEFNKKIPLSTIIERADKGLYYSKEHGRNKTNGYETLLAQGKIQELKIEKGDIELF
ncbi:MAG: GGDEF domain-containing protein [Gammaproteobacteria bacterium]|nr:GGDEF domain-containing protein [Gammaproteobacteria bacterium]MDH5660613.1 GGDEF domain-containing protein [Gammaproteobacteria bacterium]